MNTFFPENQYAIKVIQKLKRFGSLVQTEVLDEISVGDERLPVHGISLGSQDPQAPVLGIFGGVHGLERIGSHLILNYLNALASQSRWNLKLFENLEKFRLICIPIVNPAGMYLGRRSNANGVDLMRNAPVDAESRGVFLGSGHRIGSFLPWYRGQEGHLEKENVILKNFIGRHILSSPFSMTLDIHSGFGWHDRLWYPYARTQQAFAKATQAQRLGRCLRLAHPYHKYIIEKQSDSYLIHGDMWDYLFDFHQQAKVEKNSVFIPWTLELGSWSWLLRRPHKIFQASSLFHIEKSTSRYAFVMRKNWALLEFLQTMTCHYQLWSGQELDKEMLNRVVGL